MSPNTRETLIVGAGPVGLTAALAMNALGREVTVLEAGGADRERPGSRAIFTHSASLAVLDRLSPGLAKTLSSHGLYWNTQRTLYAGKEVYAKTYPDPAPGTYPHFTSLPQVHIERHLLEAAKAAGIEFAWNQEVVGAVSTEDGVALETASGDRWEAQYVIGADGARSPVRKQIGARMEGDKDDGWYVVVDVRELPDAPLPIERVFHYAHPAVGGRNVLMVPFTGGWRVDLQLKPGDIPEDFSNEETVKKWLREVMPPAYADQISWVSTYQFMQLIAHDFSDPARRVLLVGEAAHLFAPFGARGLNSGIPDAEVAALAVNSALSATNPAMAKAAVESFGLARRSAAQFNCNAASEALVHLRPDTDMIARLEAAAERAPEDAEASAWLEKAPYGPRGVPTATTVYRY